MKVAVIAIAIAVVLIAGAIFTSRDNNNNSVAESTSNASVSGDKQIVEITAKGGYSPRTVVAKADTPTIVRVKTEGTFDCSSALTIPSIGYRKNLPASGTTDIEIPAQKAGSVLQGVCSMGMYGFQVQFN